MNDSNWNIGEPDLEPEPHKPLFCILLNPVGKWSDVPCDHITYTLCQFHVKDISVPYFTNAIGLNTLTPIASDILKRLNEVEILKENFSEFLYEHLRMTDTLNNSILKRLDEVERNLQKNFTEVSEKNSRKTIESKLTLTGSLTWNIR